MAPSESTSGFSLDERLLRDCHRLGQYPNATLLLHRNPAVFWLILVPHTEVEDFLDLPQEQRQMLTEQCAGLSAFVKSEGFPKVNFAAIGNVVSQMHLHVVGRAKSDPVWPAPVWGNLPEPTDQYRRAEIDQIREKLGRKTELMVCDSHD